MEEVFFTHFINELSQDTQHNVRPVLPSLIHLNSRNFAACLQIPLAAEEECGKHSSLYFLRGHNCRKAPHTLLHDKCTFLCFYFIFYDLVQIQTDTDGWRRYLVSNYFLEFPRLAMLQNSTTFRRSV